jgi:UDP-N-acetylglucosamine 4-epimerase
VFARCYGLPAVGLRYFNVFGARQRPDGPYAAVIPKWVGLLLRGEEVEIFGDGETRRDFSYVANVAQANILAATSAPPEASGQAYNIAFGGATSLNQLFDAIRGGLADRVGGSAGEKIRNARAAYRGFRPGDIRDSLAATAKARTAFGYEPTHDLKAGLAEALDWYVDDFERSGQAGQ